MTTTTARLTLEQFLDLPEQKPALEFDADGTIHEKMSPNTEHSALQAHIGHLLLRRPELGDTAGAHHLFMPTRYTLAGSLVRTVCSISEDGAGPADADAQDGSRPGKRMDLSFHMERSGPAPGSAPSARVGRQLEDGFLGRRQRGVAF
jgi:hypothetical protein